MLTKRDLKNMLGEAIVILGIILVLGFLMYKG